MSEDCCLITPWTERKSPPKVPYSHCAWDCVMYLKRKPWSTVSRPCDTYLRRQVFCKLCDFAVFALNALPPCPVFTHSATLSLYFTLVNKPILRCFGIHSIDYTDILEPIRTNSEDENSSANAGLLLTPLFESTCRRSLLCYVLQNTIPRLNHNIALVPCPFSTYRFLTPT